MANSLIEDETAKVVAMLDALAKETEDRKKIASLNDEIRSQVGLISDSDHVRSKFTVVQTDSIASLKLSQQERIFKEVRNFDNFSEDNDPYGEHDFGNFEYEDQTIYWKIDYYDNDRLYGSEDPADHEITHRVLTIMFSSEY